MMPRRGTYQVYVRDQTEGQRLRELRLAAGLSQRELGAMLFYHQNWISRVERDRAGEDAATETLVAAAMALHTAGLKELPWQRRGALASHPLGKRRGKGKGKGPRPYARGAAARRRLTLVP